MAGKKQPEPIVESLAIAVPPAQAWEALTSPRTLGDIVMGHVEIDPRPQGAFSWHFGVLAEAAPGRVDPSVHLWKGTVLDCVPGSTLVLGGAGESTAVFTVKGNATASLVTVVQGHVPRRFDLEDCRRAWADFLLKLKTALERPPYAESVFLRTLLRATPAQVMQAWLSGTAMSKILPGKARVQARPGGKFQWERKEGSASGTFLEIVKGHRVSFTWEAGGRPCEVRLTAERTPYGALVSLEQIGSPGGGRTETQRRMWAHLLERLRVYFKYGKKIRTR